MAHIFIYEIISYTHILSLWTSIVLFLSKTPSSLYFSTTFRRLDSVCVQMKPTQLGPVVIASPYSDWLRAGRPRHRNSSPGRVKNCVFLGSSRLTLGPTQPPIQCTSGALSLGVKRSELEADHSPPASAEVKKMWNCISTPTCAFMT
jgi:hypothetical protein